MIGRPGAQSDGQTPKEPQNTRGIKRAFNHG